MLPICPALTVHSSSLPITPKMTRTQWTVLVALTVLGLALLLLNPGRRETETQETRVTIVGTVPIAPVQPGRLETGQPEFARSELPSNAARQWRVLILDAVTRLPIPTARLQLILENRPYSLGSTSTEGYWEGQIPDAMASWLVLAQADGYLDQEMSCDAQTVEITLNPAGSIRGTVHAEGLTDVSSHSFWVIAWRSEVSDQIALAPMEHLPNDYTTLAPVQEDGAFILENLERDVSYSLLCVGEGYGTPELLRRVRADGQSVVLTIAPVHGVLITFRDSLGGPLRAASALFQELPHTNYRVLSEPSEVLAFTSPNAVVLGLKEAVMENLANSLAALTFKRSPVDPVIEYSAVRPGYRQVTGAFTVPQILDGLPRVEVAMSPWAEKWGKVEVRIKNSNPPSGREFNYGTTPDAVVRLVARDLLADPLEVPLVLEMAWPDLSKPTLIVGPLPAGFYSVALNSMVEELQSSSDENPQGGLVQEVEIRDGEIAQIVFDASMRSCLNLDPRDGGAAYLGPLVVMLENSEGGGAHFSFGGPPYRIPLMPALPVTVGLVPGFRGLPPGHHFAPVPVALIPGLQSELVIHLPAGR